MFSERLCNLALKMYKKLKVYTMIKSRYIYILFNLFHKILLLKIRAPLSFLEPENIRLNLTTTKVIPMDKPGAERRTSLENLWTQGQMIKINSNKSKKKFEMFEKYQNVFECLLETIAITCHSQYVSMVQYEKNIIIQFANPKKLPLKRMSH